MKVSIVGSGYVGLVTGACLADVGNTVLCFDVDRERIASLKDGIIPIYEPGLEDIVKRNILAGRMMFTDDPKDSVTFGELQFLAVGTPPGEDGSADLQYILKAAQTIGDHMTTYKVIVDKSTVPVGTAGRIRTTIQEAQKRRGLNLEFSVVSNPEFLKEGAAVEDFMRPDRIIIGTTDERAIELLNKLYKPFQRNHEKIILMSERSAELTKYAANAMLATRISFMNELANLAEILGADIESVRKGIGADPRIGHHFLYPGCGYGGSCFPKDILALRKTARDHGGELQILSAVENVNRSQKSVLVKKLKKHLGNDLKGRTIALWGLAFKPNTDDIREAPSLDIIRELQSLGANLQLFDPIAMKAMKGLFPETATLKYCARAEEAVRNAEALLVITEWKDFRSPDFNHIKGLMKSPLVLDGRNIYEPEDMKNLGFNYDCIGRNA